MVTNWDRELERFEEFIEMDEGMRLDEFNLDEIEEFLKKWSKDFGSGMDAGLSERERNSLVDGLRHEIMVQGKVSDEEIRREVVEIVKRRKWSTRDEKNFSRLYKSDMSVAEIAERFGRSRGSLYSKAHRLRVKRGLVREMT